MVLKQTLHAAIACSTVYLGSLGMALAAGSELIAAEDVEFIALNPLRGNLSPRSGKLWGNIREDEPAGMLVTFIDGFQSPPHIHNITYRAVVIDGEIHNDDPDAAKFWMEPGSFWTQPAGETHITAARGEDPMIFLEILSGPYLVQPAEQEFDTGERPINVAARNIMWLGAANAARIEGDGAAMAYLWGGLNDEEKNGTMVKLAPGYRGTLQTAAPIMRAVTIQGKTEVTLGDQTEASRLAPGSVLSSSGEASHQLACVSDDECVLYLHTEGSYRLIGTF